LIVVTYATLWWVCRGRVATQRAGRALRREQSCPGLSSAVGSPGNAAPKAGRRGTSLHLRGCRL